MANKLKLTTAQTIKLQTKVRLSPLQLQTAKLLGLNNAELEKAVQEELDNNAALEQGEENGYEKADEEPEEEFSAHEEGEEDYTNVPIEPQWSESSIENDDDYVPMGESRKVRRHNEESNGGFDSYIASSKTQMDELMEQVNELNIPKRFDFLVRYILQTLDDDGFLSRRPNQLVNDLLFTQGEEYSLDEVNAAIKVVQSLEPWGIGATNLQESLLLQLAHLNDNDAKRLAERILNTSYEEWMNKNYNRIMARHKVNEAELAQALDLIRHLNPHPGRFSSSEDVVINQEVPDFVVHDNNGHLTLTLNRPHIPMLKVSDSYLAALDAEKGKEHHDIIAKQVDAARLFIDSLAQRDRTMMGVMHCIVQMQRKYFETGDVMELKPMILKDVAGIVGCDESTVSRVTSNKSVQTDFGVVKVRSLFSEAMKDASGNEVSVRQVKEMIMRMVESEDKRSPLTDQQLEERLRKEGFLLSRRTVAKYRDELGVPRAIHRKQL